MGRKLSRCSLFGLLVAACCPSITPPVAPGTPDATPPPSAPICSTSVDTNAPTRTDPLSTDPQLGQVFASAEAFAQTRYPAYPDDENIVVQPIAGSSLVWVRDITPRINGRWHLLERLASGQARYVLCHGAAEVLKAQPSSLADPIELEEILQPLPARHHVTYGFDEARGYYVPGSCVTQVTVVAAEGAGRGLPRDANAAPQTGQASPPTVEIPWDCEQRLFRCE